MPCQGHFDGTRESVGECMTIKTLEGARAISEIVRNCDPDVVACYPISPSTHVAEQLNQYYVNGDLKSFIAVESEFSAMSALVGGAAAGGRTFTVTSAQGLLLMHEVLFNASGMRLPIVMCVANRAISAPLSIWNDEQDSMSQRDSGWIQLYGKNNQEGVDLMVQAYFIAEKTHLPVMVCIDGHYLTHAVEQIDILDKEQVLSFLPPIAPAIVLDPEKPVSMGVYASPVHYQDFRKDLWSDMQASLLVIEEAGRLFGKKFGRSYDLFESYQIADADRVILGLGSVMDNVKAVVDDLRREGEKVGCLHLRSFRPFPREQLSQALRNKTVGVVERDISPGSKAPLYTEVFEALKDSNAVVSSFYGGLGGRNITRAEIRGLFDKLKQNKPLDLWVAETMHKSGAQNYST